MSIKTASSWICCQLGAREHYSIPRALHRIGSLEMLLTDTWAGPGGTFARLAGPRAAERYHPDLDQANVKAFNWRLGAFEWAARRRWQGWDRVMERNDWFQHRCLSALYRRQRSRPRTGTVLFSYSYTARRLFEFARSTGIITVLGQIDPGPVEERLVAGLPAGLAAGWEPAPRSYWEQWRQECDLATAIVVNSEWSRQGLLAEGISAEKIHVVPLVYQASGQTGFSRSYPREFTAERPLRILFLGQVNLRKGLGPMLEAIPKLEGLPVRLRIVGPIQIEIPERLRRHAQVEWAGPVARGEAAEEYRNADVFLFPTLSDGFGLTQLEAQAWGLPLIASRRCGQVVREGENGWLLDPVSAKSIEKIVRQCLADPVELARRAAASSVGQEFDIAHLARRLQQCVS